MIKVTAKKSGVSLTANVINPVRISTGGNAVSLNVGSGGVTINNYTGGKLEIPFTHEDWSLGSKKIGTATGGMRVEKCAVIVDEVFNEGTIVIGDAGAHGRLMVAADIKLAEEKRFHTEPDELYEEDTDLYVYFETGLPSSGSGTIIIYLQ